jgi:tetratricopeptide (TPR) repeat protein
MQRDSRCYSAPVDAIRWNRIESVFEAALGMAPDERDAFLAGACEDEGVRQEVRALLEADGQAGAFLEEPAAQVPDPDELTRPTLAPGMVLSQRFRLVRFLASGGMGEVYEAEDLELGEHVALKIVRPDMARDAAMMQRFRREVHLARQVTHPSVCRCFDLFHHPGPQAGAQADAQTGPQAGPRARNAPEGSKSPRAEGRERPLTFLTMELIRGETLADWLAREGPLTPAQALPILQQIVAALTAAHERGIVHRDLKASNVMLDRSAPGLRVVVMDFGLAMSPGSGDDWLTTRGQVLGTPACMAPEQLMGGEVSPATDVYALGVLMHRMLTGRTPFEAEDTRVQTSRRPGESPPAPRRHAPELDPRWERVILRCLEHFPGARYASAHEVLASLRAATPRPRAQRWRQVAAVLGSVAFAGLVTGTLVLAPPLELSMVRHAPQGTTQRVVELVERSLEEIQLAAEARDHEAAHAWESAENGYRRLTELRPDDVGHALRLATVQTRAGKAQEALALLDALRARRGDRTPRTAVEIALAEAEAAELTADYERSLRAATRAVQRGQELGDDHLRGHAHYREARAHWRLGHHAQALAHVQTAAELYAAAGDRIGGAGALVLQANVHEEQARPDLARTLYEQALTSYRAAGHQEGVVEVLTNLAIVVAGEAHDRALALLEEATTVARAIRDRDGEARALHNQAWIYKTQGAYDPARTFYERALALAEEIGNESIQSSAMSSLASILRMQGKLRESVEMDEKALRLARASGDLEGISRRLNNLGLTLRLQGDLSGALGYFQEALDAARSLNDQRGVAQRLTHMAAILRMQGQLDEAQGKLEQALAVHETITDPGGHAFTLRSQGLLFLARGELVEARRALEKAQAVGEQTEPAEELLTRRALAALALAEGKLDQAERLVRGVIEERTALEHRGEALDGWLLLARIELRRARVAEARAALDEAKRLQMQPEDQDLERSLRTRLITAELDAAEGKRALATARLEAVARDARGAGMTELAGEIERAQAALAEGEETGQPARGPARPGR